MASIKRVVKKNGKVVYRIRVSLGQDKQGKQNIKVHTYEVDQNATPTQQEKQALKYSLTLEDKLSNGFHT